MSKRKITITEADKSRLEELIAVAEEFGSRSREDLESLKQELTRARVVASIRVPPDVVTMNSKVTLHDQDTGEEMTYVLAFPNNVNTQNGAISVLAPIGTAILGYAKGDSIKWNVPAGIRRILIKDVLYQPEAAGHFHL